MRELTVQTSHGEEIRYAWSMKEREVLEMARSLLNNAALKMRNCEELEQVWHAADAIKAVTGNKFWTDDREA